MMEPRRTLLPVLFAFLGMASCLLLPRLTLAAEEMVRIENSADMKARVAAGEPDAQYQLALFGIAGAQGAPGREEAADLLLAAANQQHDGASFVLGALYLRGRIVGKDVERAAQLFRLAADRGHPPSQNALGLLITKQQGDTADATEARHLFEAAAAAGLVEAKSNLGVLLVTGQETPEDVQRGVDLLRSIVSEKPTAEAFVNYGWLYDTGAGVPADSAEARKWYGRAADLGSSRASYNLAMLAMRDERTSDAMEWLMIAAAGADQGYKDRSRAMITFVAGRMTATEVDAAGQVAKLYLSERAAK